MFVHAVVPSGAIALVIVIATPSPLLLRLLALGMVVLLRRKAGKTRHLQSNLLLELLQLPHCFHRVTVQDEACHIERRAARRKRGRIGIQSGRIGISVLQLLHWLRAIWVYIAPTPSATSGLLERPSTALELLARVRRIVVATVLKAALAPRGYWNGRKVGLVGKWSAEGRLRCGDGLRLGRGARTADVRSVLDRLNEVVGEDFGIYTMLFSTPSSFSSDRNISIPSLRKGVISASKTS